MQGAVDLTELAISRHAKDMREMWQGRVLAAAMALHNGVARPRDVMGAVILSVLAHNFDDAMPVLLRVVFPGYTGLGVPMLCSAGRIAKNGVIMADMIGRGGIKHKNQAFFKDERALEKAFRKLADSLILPDTDRIELFEAVKRWVVCDYRLDPTMNPADPDAKRLTVH